MSNASSPFETSSRPTDERPIQRSGSFPLLALFQLVAVWAAILACSDGERLAEIFRPSLAAAAALATLSGLVALIGALIGLKQVKMWRSAAGGAMIGAIYGAALFCVYAAPAGLVRAFAAAALLMAFTIVCRFRTP